MKKIIALVLTIFAFACVSTVNFEGNNSIIPSAQAREYRQVQAYHILVPTEKEAIAIREEILKGQNQQEIFENFMTAAKKYSKCPSGRDGGKLGWFKRGEMVSEFEEVAFSIPNGQVSEPVKTQFGWHLIYDISKK